MEIEREAVHVDPLHGNKEVVHTREEVASPQAVEARKAVQSAAYVWYVISFLETPLFIRLVFLLLGANATGFTSIIYALTHPITALFQGIFPSPNTSSGYFDVATVLAMVVLALIGWGIVSLIDINKRKQA